MAQKSILLVTVDCLRADHVGFMGYERPTTPFLDSLALESSVFPAAIVAGAPTYYSFPAILASRYPLALGRDILGLGPDEPTLASALNKAGYATASFGAANPYLTSRFGYDHGFEVFRGFLGDDLLGDDPLRDLSNTDVRNEPALPSDARANGMSGNGWASRLNRRLQKVRPALGPLRVVYDELYFQYCQRSTPVAHSLDVLRRFPSADVLVDEANRWLESIGNVPFFLWLHLMDPHSPYYPKNEALTLMGCPQVSPFRARYLNSCWNRSDLGPSRLERYRDEVIKFYDAGIRWVDRQLGRLIERMRKSRQWDHCIFAFTADHGEEFLDHDGRYHSPSRLTEELIRVPLLLRVPDTTKRAVTNSPFTLLHLAPTLLDAAGVPIPSAFRGTSHWPQVRDGRSYEAVAISECVAGCTNPFQPEKRLGPRVLSVRESRYKLVLHFDRKVEDLYDLEADPGEHVPLPPGGQKPVRRRLLGIAREHLCLTSERRDAKLRLQARLRELRLEWKKPASKASPVVS
jgi:arylsulfatase A-like enzyme